MRITHLPGSRRSPAGPSWPKPRHRRQLRPRTSRRRCAQAGAAAKPQVVKGLVDTGASISTVSDAVAQAAGLQAVGSVPLYGVGGGGERPIYAASFGLQAYGVVVDPIEIAGVTIPMPGVDILVGRDILKALRLDYKGPAGAFTLTQEGGTPLERAGAAPG